MADEKILLEIEVDNDAAIVQLEKQNKEIEQLEKSQKDLAKQGKKNSKEFQLQAKQLKDVRKERNENIKSLDVQSGSLQAQRNKLSALKSEWANVDQTTKQGAQRFKELTKEAKKLNDEIKEQEEGVGDFRRSVGEYGNALKGIIPATGDFGGALEGVGQVIKLNPIGLLISGVVALFAAFSKTEKGAKFFKIALAVINTVFETLVGSVGTLAEDLIDVFNNPTESLKNFANLVENYVLSKVDILIDMFGFLGDVIKKVFEGDFDGALESAKKAGEAYIDANPFVDLFEASADAAGDLTKKIIENVDATITLENQNYALQRSMLATQKQIAKLEGQEAQLQKQAEDSTLSFQDQAKAQEELQKVQEQRFKKQESLISDEISIINQRFAIAKKNNQDTLEIQRELTEKTKELIGVRNEAALSETENLQISRQRNQDIWEQELDFIIDVGEKEVEIYKKIAEDESLSIEERKAALKNYESAYANFLATQRKQFEEEGLSEEEFNRLLGIKDPAELAQAITDLEELSEVEKNRLREVFIEFKNAEMEKLEIVESTEDQIRKQREITAELTAKKLDEEKQLRRQLANDSVSLLNDVFNFAKVLGKKDEKLQQDLGIAQAVINTAVGVTKAFSQLGPIAGIPAAAGIAVKGATQIAAIKAASNGGGGGGTGDISGGALSQQAPDTTQIDQQIAQQEALQAAISNLGLTVSVTEINEVQNAVQVSEQTSQI